MTSSLPMYTSTRVAVQAGKKSASSSLTMGLTVPFEASRGAEPLEQDLDETAFAEQDEERHAEGEDTLEIVDHAAASSPK